MYIYIMYTRGKYLGIKMPTQQRPQREIYLYIFEYNINIFLYKCSSNRMPLETQCFIGSYNEKNYWVLKLYT